MTNGFLPPLATELALMRDVDAAWDSRLLAVYYVLSISVPGEDGEQPPSTNEGILPTGCRQDERKDVVEALIALERAI